MLRGRAGPPDLTSALSGYLDLTVQAVSCRPSGPCGCDAAGGSCRCDLLFLGGRALALFRLLRLLIVLLAVVALTHDLLQFAKWTVLKVNSRQTIPALSAFGDCVAVGVSRRLANQHRASSPAGRQLRPERPTQPSPGPAAAPPWFTDAPGDRKPCKGGGNGGMAARSVSRGNLIACPPNAGAPGPLRVRSPGQSPPRHCWAREHRQWCGFLVFCRQQLAV
jgi:hypothetical protein